ncbi:MAG: hypothetical protein NE328_08840 [Lentisphaeraceae bacterium]|nr:hypothetical protein [Lentisphaeraceae bacterium]
MFQKSLHIFLLAVTLFLFSCSKKEDQKTEIQATNTITGKYILNGKPIDENDLTHVRDLGIDKDLVLVDADGIKLLLNNGETYKLEGDQYKTGRIFRNIQNSKVLIGLSDINNFHFNSLKYEEIKYIRGINFHDAPYREFMEGFLSLDLSKIFIQTYDGIPIHSQVAFLKYTSFSDNPDFSVFKNFNSLLYLDLSIDDELVFDCNFLKNSTKLIYLNAERLINTSELNALTHLKYLNVGKSKITDMDHFKELLNLKELYISQTGITDITAIVHLKKITDFDMNYSEVKTIPLVNIPHLKSLNIRNTKVSLKDFQKFKELNPQCYVSYSMNDQLQDALTEIDYIRVRTGGTCHTNPDEEETIFEIKDKVKIKEFISHLKIEEEATFQCQCCGSPSFEFYINNKLQETLGFHHGRSIRWHERPFGDAYLTGESIDYLCKILFDNGVKHHWEERLIDKEMEKIGINKINLSLAQLPEGIKNLATKEGIKWYDVAIAYIKGEKNKSLRIKAALKFLGAHNGSYKFLSTWDRMAFRVLNNEFGDSYQILDKDKISIPDIISVLKENRSDQVVIKGVIRWLFNFYDYEYFSKNQLKEIVEIIIKTALTHPRLLTRVKAMETLKELSSSFWSRYYLRKVLQGKYVPNKLNEELLEPRWWKSGGTNIMRLDAPCSDFEYAATILTEIDDQPSISIIKKKLSTETNEIKKKALQKALGLDTD